MPDWTQYIRQNLQLSHLMVEREAEVIEDLAQQLEDAYTDALHRGLSPSQAEAAAQKHITDWPALAKQIESLRAGRESAMSALQNRAADRDIAKRGEFSFFTGLMQDIRFGLRTLRKNLGFTAIAVLTLALGIGANTAIFSVVYGVLLQPLPYQDAAGLILLNETTPRVGTVSVSYPNFLDWRTQSSQFSQMAAVSGVGFNLAGVNQPEAISGQAVSPNFLSLLGVKPFLGRDFDPSEEKAGASPVLLLSYSLWQSHFGADPSALGRTIMLDGRGYVDCWSSATQLPLAGKDGRSRTDWRVGRTKFQGCCRARRAWRFGCAGPARPGRDFRAGSFGDGRNRLPARQRVSRSERSVRRRAQADPRRIRKRNAPGYPGAVWRGHICFADRLRQCRQFVARARLRQNAGDCAALGPGRNPQTHCSADADGEFSAGPGWVAASGCSWRLRGFGA